MVKKAKIEDAGVLAGLATQMWPDHEREDLEAEFRMLVMNDEEAACFIKYAGNRPIAFAQCQLRHDYVEGTDSSPVGYLEGVFVSGFTCLWDLRKPIGSSVLEKICRFSI